MSPSSSFKPSSRPKLAKRVVVGVLGVAIAAVLAWALVIPSRVEHATASQGHGASVAPGRSDRVATSDYEELTARLRISAALLCLLGPPLLWLLATRLATPLRDLNLTLETRVAERTAALADGNAALLRAMRERRQSDERLRRMTDLMPALVAHIDTDLRYTFVNATYSRWLGRSFDEAVGARVIDVIGVQSFERVEDKLRRALAGEACAFEEDLFLDGREIHFLINYSPDLGDDGVVHGIYSTVFDLSELKGAQLRSAAGERRLRTIADNLPVLITYFDSDQRYRFVNATYKKWLGVDPESLIGRTLLETMGSVDYGRFQPYVLRALAGERVDFDLESPRGFGPRHLRSTFLPDVVNGGVYALVVDVTAIMAAEAQLALLARTDSLTGLPNRHAFNEMLDAALVRSRCGGTPIALFFIDVDCFKAINDSLGHGAGDVVLKHVGQRLRASVRSTDVVARLAGDEFVVILEGLHTPEEPREVARKVLAAMSVPLELEGRSLDVTASIGIAYHRDGGVPSAELLADADKALYAAKDAGRNTFRMATA